jgi:hypothetical protein
VSVMGVERCEAELESETGMCYAARGCGGIMCKDEGRAVK